MKSLYSIIILLFLCLNFGLADESIRTVHIFVCLNDNEAQNIVPTLSTQGNGNDPTLNLYWGPPQGVRFYFESSSNWQIQEVIGYPRPDVIERCVFKHQLASLYLVADAYRGKSIRRAIVDFLSSAGGNNYEEMVLSDQQKITIGGGADLVGYYGFNGLMDFELYGYPLRKDDHYREAVILSPESRISFELYLRRVGAYPLLWFNAPVLPHPALLDSVLESWMDGENNDIMLKHVTDSYLSIYPVDYELANSLFHVGW